MLDYDSSISSNAMLLDGAKQSVGVPVSKGCSKLNVPQSLGRSDLGPSTYSLDSESYMDVNAIRSLRKSPEGKE